MQLGFIPALLTEIKLQQPYLSGISVDTIYFGGGTPSLIKATEIESILRQLRAHYTVSNTAEITLEANPDDITTEIVNQWKDMGINRLSLGIQSFHDDDLKYLFRTHDNYKSKRAIDLILQAGIQNLSIDLIYGIPGLNAAKWQSNLDLVIEYGIPHLSAYWLSVEEGTALQKLIFRNKLKIPNDEDGIEQFNMLQQWSENNAFIHYEVSNLGKEGYFSRHNQSYWKGLPYLGFGPSAHSFNGNTRQWNVSSLSTYRAQLMLGIVPCEMETLSPLIQYEELIMTGLRTIWGVDMKRLGLIFGESIRQNCLKLAKPYLESGHLMLEDSILKLGKTGWLISDHIIADLFMEQLDFEV